MTIVAKRFVNASAFELTRLQRGTLARACSSGGCDRWENSNLGRKEVPCDPVEEADAGRAPAP
jgi:hypothetical protein